MGIFGSYSAPHMINDLIYAYLNSGNFFVPVDARVIFGVTEPILDKR